MAVWTQPPLCSKSEITRAGWVLTGKAQGNYTEAVSLISRWRAAHAFPLNTFQVTLRDRAKRINGTAVTTQRLKRLEAIRVKLDRFYPTMNLAGVQDIGGCRAVVFSVEEVNALAAFYEPQAMRHEFRRHKDYIQQPKEDGYRAIHVVYRYASESDEQRPWNGLETEIQLRSLLQHAWASAVETVDFFAKQKIKSGIKEGAWARFFVLMGNAIAEREKQPLMPTVPQGEELRRELRESAQFLQVVRSLRAWARARSALRPVDTKRATFFLVRLDTATMKVRIRGFTTQQQKAMEAAYADAEKDVESHPERQAVLVGAESVAELKRGYASFVVEPQVFITALHWANRGLSTSAPLAIP
jgi:ppGpp synthetase/RelA/SpoT-type nucleotidyltranferase